MTKQNRIEKKQYFTEKRINFTVYTHDMDRMAIDGRLYMHYFGGGNGKLPKTGTHHHN